MTYLYLIAQLVVILLFSLPAYAYGLRLERHLFGSPRLKGAGGRGWLAPLKEALPALLKPNRVASRAMSWRMGIAAALALGASLAMLLVIPWGSLILAGQTLALLTPGPKTLLAALILEGLLLLAMALYRIALPTPEARRESERSLMRAGVYGLAALLALGGPIMLAGSFDLERMVAVQALNLPLVVYQPLGALLCLLAMALGCARMPLSLPGAQDRLLESYQLRHAGASLALFHWSEYLHLFAWAALWATVYLGGAEGVTLGGPVGLLLAALLVLGVIVWIRNRPLDGLRARWGRYVAPMLLGLCLVNMALTTLMRYWGQA